MQNRSTDAALGVQTGTKKGADSCRPRSELLAEERVECVVVVAER